MSNEMSNSMSKNKSQVILEFFSFNKLAQLLNLGEVKSLQEITGGTLHRTYKLATTQGVYAVRLLNICLLHLQNKRLHFFNQAEQVAAFMQAHDIPAVVALQYAGQYVIEVDKQQVMVFPWVEGLRLSDAEVSLTQAQKMGEILAKIHRLKLDAFDIELFHWQSFTAEYWQHLFAQAEKHPWYLQIKTMLPDLINWSYLIAQALPQLKQNMILSHRDLNAFNVIWRNDSPLIIDWEFAGYINPILELFIVAINWSRVGVNYIDPQRYQAVLSTYKSLTGVECEITSTIVHGYLGYCSDWLEFNLRRALIYPEDVIAVQEMLTTYQVIKYVMSSFH